MTREPWKRPGPFAQDPARTPPTRAQREKDYLPEKKETGAAARGEGLRDRPMRDKAVSAGRRGRSS